ncbi:MAG: hypothetical protein B5M56_09300 [Desulfococcus sp. 4484_241]|nr:MAG: hypothetical protein B5M56_09300 [Desulfococcus sp. 4484_241]
MAVALILAALEAGMRFLVCHPDHLRRMSRKLQNSIGYLYIQGERKVMPFLKECSRYSPDFGYTLKPGRFVFTEREFSNTYHINSLGVRASEEALDGPQVVILGDSFAFGWGVDQDEIFSSLLEKRTNLKFLNTAVPSFGTVREMIMLRSIDRSRLRCIILQYCGDDYDENIRYYRNGNRPQIMRKQTFHRLVRLHSRPRRYFFGKYLWMKIKKKTNEFMAKRKKTGQPPPMDETDMFLYVLKQNRDILDGIPIVMFEMNGVRQENRITSLLAKRAAHESQPEFIRNMRILDLSGVLKDEHYYVLDGHMTPEGHRILADTIYDALCDMGII